jgi:Cytochrome c oxidase subunit IV
MIIGGKLFAFGTVLFFVLGAVYWVMSGDVIGTSLLALTGGLAFLIAFYVLFTSKRVGALPEDNDYALISDADTDYGFFSPHSWWPFVIGASTFVFILGFVFARWMMVVGLFAIMMAIYGLVFEYYRGEFAK